MTDRPPLRRGALALAAGMALLDVGALAVDFTTSLARALAAGRSVPGAAFGYVRFFTIQSNLFLAVLMGVTALALVRRRPLPPTGAYRALTAYMIVTGATYELLLRGTWSPRGLQFVTDMVFHDVEPALTVAFWLAFAPKRSLRWGSLPFILVFPAFYLALTLAAGLFGAGYPYAFIDARALGYGRLAGVASAFLAAFLGLGALLTLLGRGALRGGRSPAARHRSWSSRS